MLVNSFPKKFVASTSTKFASTLRFPCMQYAAWVPRRSAVQVTGNVVGIPFLPMLQIAAGRAWARHSSSIPRRAPDSKKSQSKKTPIFWCQGLVVGCTVSFLAVSGCPGVFMHSLLGITLVSPLWHLNLGSMNGQLSERFPAFPRNSFQTIQSRI